VSFRPQPSLIVILVVVLCVGVVAGVAMWRLRAGTTTQALLQHLPQDPGVTLGIDLEALRHNGLMAALARLSTTEEPEYQAFVKDTGFNYEMDLDYALAWFGKQGTFLLLRGRFDWPRLRQYAINQKGTCHNTFCDLEGSTPARLISFFPLKRDVMAMAVGPAAGAAWELSDAKPQDPSREPPQKPVWLMVPSAVLKDAQNLPAAVRPFSQALEGTELVQLSMTLGPEQLELLLDVTCRTPGEASSMSSQLEQATRLLRGVVAQSKQPDPTDLAAVLAQGAFRSQDRKVSGRWPIERAFVEGILGVSH